MAVVIAPRPRGLQPIHSPVSSLMEPAEIGDEPPHHTVKGTVNHKDRKTIAKLTLSFFSVLPAVFKLYFRCLSDEVQLKL